MDYMTEPPGGKDCLAQKECWIVMTIEAIRLCMLHGVDFLNSPKDG